MRLFSETITPVEGLKAKTGDWSVTTGSFRIRTYFDTSLASKGPAVGHYIFWHEAAHRRYRHGLISVLLFPIARWLRPLFEAQADRYAVSIMGRRKVLQAMTILKIAPEAKFDKRIDAVAQRA